MFQIDEEMLNLAQLFHEAGVSYAVCGALALGIHGHPRATRDIDFIIQLESMFEARRVAKANGFIIEAAPMKFQGVVHVIRLSKALPDEEDLLTVDLLIYNSELSEKIKVEAVEYKGETVNVVTRDTLIMLKSQSTRLRDQDDVQRLTSGDVED
jgi:hypothetical protein